MDDENSFSYPVWIKRGIMLVRREGLDIDDPESVPSLWMKKFKNLDNFPFNEFFGEGSQVEKQILQARNMSTDILRMELKRRRDLGEL